MCVGILLLLSSCPQTDYYCFGDYVQNPLRHIQTRVPRTSFSCNPVCQPAFDTNLRGVEPCLLHAISQVLCISLIIFLYPTQILMRLEQFLVLLPSVYGYKRAVRSFLRAIVSDIRCLSSNLVYVCGKQITCRTATNLSTSGQPRPSYVSCAYIIGRDGVHLLTFCLPHSNHDNTKGTKPAHNPIQRRR